MDFELNFHRVQNLLPSLSKSMPKSDAALLRDLLDRIEKLELERDIAEDEASYWRERAESLEDQLEYYIQDE